MCGIAAVMLSGGTAPLGLTVAEMLKMIRHRGGDSSGLALYTPPPGDGSTHWARISLRNPERDVETVQEIMDRFGRLASYRIEPSHSAYWVLDGRVEVEPERLTDLYRAIDERPELCVHSLSRTLKVYKDLGNAENLEAYRDLAGIPCTHLIGHVRLATESLDNLNFAHPFSSPLQPDLAIVHNGQLTNYFNLRRRLERRGVRFKTQNDSELIAHYLAWKVGVESRTLSEAMADSLDELDGVYSYLVSTAKEIGAVQDRLGLKPILIHESDEMVLIGSEQICFSPVLMTAYGLEIRPGEARVWSN